jgi:RNA polymerase sigma factor (TIGR02999 family)
MGFKLFVSSDFPLLGRTFSPYNKPGHSMSPNPSTGPAGEVSALLVRWGNGDQQALGRLMPLVYGRLRRLARAHLRNERPDISLQGTDLVHEAYLHLAKQHSPDWENRKQFFAFAAHVMRRILVDHARKHEADKRVGSKMKVPLDEAAEAMAAPERSQLEILALDCALDQLTKLDGRQGQIVELRFFGGCSIAETAELLGLSDATIKREWITARAWLKRAIRQEA